MAIYSLDVNALNIEGYSRLHLDVLRKNHLMVQKLLSSLVNIDVDTRSSVDTYEKTALHFAVKSGDLSIIKALLDQGADVNIESSIKGASEE